MKRILLMGMASAAAFGAGIEVHGHRGARAVRPENTLPAFEYAIAAGVDALELDMAVTKDNVLVVSHDAQLRSPVCTGPRDGAVIRELMLAEVRQWDCGAHGNPAFPKQQAVPGTKMPTLDEVFALAPKGSFLFNIETKIFPAQPELTPPPEEFAKLVLEAIRRHHLESRVVLQSFDFRTLLAMEKLAPEIKRSALYSGTPKDFVAIGQEGHARIVSPTSQLVTAEQVKAAHAAGLKVLPWTVNTPDQWKKLVTAGVDGIITDDPAALIAWLRDRSARK
ncbi:MAG: glycerophosphodiester phosphodiesterase [Candidatus Solibacter sp.]